MNKKHLIISAVVAVALAAGIVAWPRGLPRSAKLIQSLQASDDGGRWWRGNLHAHSIASDGDLPAAQVADWYRTHGYDFTALTEHDVLGPVPLAGASRTGFLVLRGEEVSNAVGSASVHVGVIEPARAIRATLAGDVVPALEADAASAQRVGALAQLNHPNYAYSVTAEQMMRARGIGLFEVFNGHPLSHNAGDGVHPSTERLWDIALAFRIAALRLPMIYGTATDDAHDYGPPSSDAASPGRGWVMVFADTLSPTEITRALGAGRFYATTGVLLERVLTYDQGVRVQVAEEPDVDYLIEFIGTRRGFDARSTPAVGRQGQPVYGTRTYSGDIGRVLASHEGSRADYVFDRDDLYVRARITSTRRHPNPSAPLQFEQAWTQPVAGPAAAQADAAAPVPSVALHASVQPTLRRQPAEVAATRRVGTTDCSLDILADAQNRPTNSFAQRDSLYIGGWIADRARPSAPDAVALLLRGGSKFLAEIPNGVRRADVAAVLGNPALEAAGFNATLRLAGVPHDTYAVVLVAYYGTQPVTCNTGKRIRVHAAMDGKAIRPVTTQLALTDADASQSD